MIKRYHTDNGIFNISEFMEDLLKQQQKIRFSGAGALHQNGPAERAIKTVVTIERSMLRYAALRCPEEKLCTDTFPMAMDYALWIYNQIPDMKYILSSIEIWSRSRFEPVPENLINCHVWGC